MNDKKYLILSIDGGGLRGIIPVQFLKYIEQRTGKRIHQMVHLVTGTSTGGLIACALTAGNNNEPLFTMQDIEKIYVERGNDIFPRKKGLAGFFRSIKSVFDPKYSPDGLKKVIHEKFQQTSMRDCVVPILVPAYDVENNVELIFKSRYAKMDARWDTTLFNVCLCTSAGPTFLPSFEFEYPDRSGNPVHRDCIDGGVYINNPSIAALVEFTKLENVKFYTGVEMEQKDIDALWKNMMVLSLGTGHYTSKIKKAKNMGLLEWVTRIADIMMQAVSQVTDYEANEILEPGNFLRLQVDIDEEKYADMSDSSEETRNHLKQLAESKLKDATTIKMIDDFLLKAGLLPTQGTPVV